MIKIAVCDDEPEMTSFIRNQIKLVLQEKKIAASVTEYTQSRLLKYDTEENLCYDLIFCDIEMPEPDGMELISLIRERFPETVIVLVPEQSKYAVEVFEFSVFRYVPKSLFKVKLKGAIEDALDLIRHRKNDYYYVCTPTFKEKIALQKIMMIYREGKNIYLLTTDGKKISLRKSLAEIIRELDPDSFLYINRGTIINLEHVIRMKGGYIDLSGDIQLEISKVKKEEVGKKIEEYWEKQAAKAADLNMKN